MVDSARREVVYQLGELLLDLVVQTSCKTTVLLNAQGNMLLAESAMA